MDTRTVESDYMFHFGKLCRNSDTVAELGGTSLQSLKRSLFFFGKKLPEFLKSEKNLNTVGPSPAGSRSKAVL